jgi:putative DNA primase/helicase
MVLRADDEILSVNPDNIPTELKALTRWCCWIATPPRRRQADGTLTKKPVRADAPHVGFSKTTPSQYRDFATAERTLTTGKVKVDGLGIVCGGGVVALDIDEQVGPDGELPAHVRALLKRFSTYAELSPSGRGVRMFLRGELPGKSITSKSAGLELYGEPEYVTVTGHRLPGSPSEVAEGGDQLAELYAELTAKAASAKAKKPPPAPRQQRAAAAPLSADEVVKLATRAANGAEVEALLRGDWQRKYPTQSEAELALANYLAFYAGPGGEAVVIEVIRSSGLARDKNCDRRGDTTHLGLTVDKAFEGRSEFYDPRRNGKAAAVVAALPADKPLNGPANLLLPSTLTDAGLGRRLVVRAHGEVRWCREDRAWLAWDGRRWVSDDGERATLVAKQVADELWREFQNLGRADVTPRVLRFVQSASDARAIRAAVEMAKTEPGIPVRATELNTDPWLLNIANGTLNLLTGKLLPHTPAHLITHVADAVAFDPMANAPTWRRFMAEVTGGSLELEQFLQRSFGLVLSGDVSEQRLWLHYGDGANGKTTTLELLKYLLGPYAGSAPDELLLTTERGMEAARQVADLAGKRLVDVEETSDGRRFNEGVVKKLTGGNTIKGRHIYGKPFEVRPSWKLHVATNYRPVVRGTDGGIWRRLLLCPWGQRFDGERADLRLGEKLRAELPGVLNWLLAGFESWRAGGLSPPTIVTEATGSYATENDSIGRWLAERTLKDTHARAEAGALYLDYKAWCDESGEHAVSVKRLGVELEGRGFRKERLTSGPLRDKTVRIGIGLVSERGE